MVTTVVVGDQTVGQVTIGDGRPLVFIGGPCAIESERHSLYMAEQIKGICDKHSIPFIFKSCYDKDCRSSITSFHGLGIQDGLSILAKVREKVGVPVTSDFSNVEWVEETASVVDLIQIPAYLCRQTHLLIAAGETGKPINIKKGQFMSPSNMGNSVKKIIQTTDNNQIILTERGTFFGYDMLVNDLRSLPIMAGIGQPVCYDATHSVQLPTNQGILSKGQREFIPGLVRAAAASGIHALFMEVHDNPDQALSDPATQIRLSDMERVLVQAKEVHELHRDLISRWGVDNVT